MNAHEALLFRMKALLDGLAGEIRTGVCLPKTKSFYQTAKRDFGFRGPKVRVYERLYDRYMYELESRGSKKYI